MGRRRHFGNVRRRASGRWQATYWHNGKLHAAGTFRTKADALAHLADVETTIRHGGWVDPAGARLTVAEVGDRWLTATPTKRASSIARDRSILCRHIFPVLGHRAIGSITRADVQALVDSWSADKVPSTVARQYSCLRAVFTWATNADLLARSPCRGIRLPRVRLIDRPELAPDDLERLADALGSDRAPMMWLGVALGLRWAEVAGLTVGQIDALGGTITVDRQLGRDGNLGPPKSAASTRTMAAPVWLVDDLAAVLARRGLSAADAEALVFVNRDGSPLDYTNWRCREWVPACETAGLPNLRFHDLRAANATALIAAGVDVKTAQRRLGHSSPTVTLGLYARATAAGDRAAADVLGERLRSASRPDRARTGSGGQGPRRRNSS